LKKMFPAMRHACGRRNGVIRLYERRSTSGAA
jgi:hypothetical protein